jgi:hypothetical protein
MPTSTNFNTSPYFDDFDKSKDYYKVVFKPNTSVQVRELNQLQSILQNQIETFGDSVLQQGVVLDGCNFYFNNAQQYVKLSDVEQDGSVSIPSLYVGKFVKNSSNLVGFVVNYADGFETTSPDLKTIYVNYINSGSTGNIEAFSPGDILTVFDSNNSIYKFNVNDGSYGFSNTDEVIVTSQLAVQTTTGAFTKGDYIINPSFGSSANLQIISVDETTLSGFGYTLIEVKPRSQDLANSSSNSSFWTFDLDTAIQNINGTAGGTIRKIYGSGAKGKITTSGTGKISSVTVVSRGEGYEYTPTITVRSPGNQTYMNSLNIQAQNFVTKIKIPNSLDCVGLGYIFSISSGSTYQKGYFQQVAAQSIIVSKYNNTPNNVVVGFNTLEEIISSNEDTSLLDNTIGSDNETAPGADRLKLTPVLTIKNKDDVEANSEFFSLVEWNEGNPYKQNQQTVYSRIGKNIAETTYDSEGDFVLDRFEVATKSVNDFNLEGSRYSVVVDPGTAYINGYKVKTLNNFELSLPKGLDTKTTNTIFSLNYGNYVYVKELGGSWNFKTGATVTLYSDTKGFLSNTALINSGNTSGVGAVLGTAKIRSLSLDNNQPGTPAASYKMYLFDINMLSGKNFKNVKSIGCEGGISDVIQTPDDSGNLITVLNGTKDTALLFNSGVSSVKNSNNTTYAYRTVDNTILTSNNGSITKSIGTTDEFFISPGPMMDSYLRSLIVVPTANNLVQYYPLSGTINVSPASNVVSGTGTSFLDDFDAGDYVYIYSNGTDNIIKRVVNISSANSMTLDSPVGFTNAVATFRRAFPKNVPIPFGYRDGLTGIIDSTRKTMTLSFLQSNGEQIRFAGTSDVICSLTYNVNRENVTSATKTPNRKKFIKLNLATHPNGISGPWCIGVSDVFRLRNVYIGNSSDVSITNSNVTSNFYIDHNQKADYLGLSYLFLRPSAALTPALSDWILVEFDYFTNDSSGYYDTKSYLRTASDFSINVIDSTKLDDLTTSAASFEIPEVYTSSGITYDLKNTFDFRSSLAPTVSPSSTPAAAPLNPSETENFDQTLDKKFPVPDSTCSTVIEHYLGRYDDVYISEKNNIYVLQGIPAEKMDSPMLVAKGTELNAKKTMRCNLL